MERIGLFFRTKLTNITVSGAWCTTLYVSNCMCLVRYRFSVGARSDDHGGVHDANEGKSWNLCFLLGAMLSATDPVAVVALMKELELQNDCRR